MKTIKIMPCLDMKNGRVVKGVNFVNIKDAGATNVSMNSAVVKDPQLISNAVKKYSAAKITVAIDGKRNSAITSGFEVVVSGGTKTVGKDAVEWAKECKKLGAGTILPTRMNGDGTLKGYDLGFTKAISDAVRVPVIASGGAGTLEHFYEGVVKGGAEILLAASVFHFCTFTIHLVKKYLKQKGIKVIL